MRRRPQPAERCPRKTVIPEITRFHRLVKADTAQRQYAAITTRPPPVRVVIGQRPQVPGRGLLR
jgi:hypothetical protein